MDSRQAQENLVRQAKEVVASVDRDEVPLTAACIVSSVAAGDFTPASDLDMLMVAADGQGRHEVRRKLVQGRVFEWVVVARSHLTDVDAILRHAGLTHDMLTAIILRDDDKSLVRAQAEVAARYRQPDGIWGRTEDQLDRMSKAVKALDRQVTEGNILSAQRSHVSVLKAAFGLPRALANKRCSMARGLLFCREAVRELGWTAYLPDVLELFGAQSVNSNRVLELHALAKDIIAGSSFTPDEKAIRIRHLEGFRWLLDNAGPVDAVWPLYFWSSTNVHEAGGQNVDPCWRAWSRFAKTLGVDDGAKLRAKATSADQFLRSATDIATEYARHHGMHPNGPAPDTRA